VFKTLIPLALFALAFGGALLFQKRLGAAAPEPAVPMPATQMLRMARSASGTAPVPTPIVEARPALEVASVAEGQPARPAVAPAPVAPPEVEQPPFAAVIAPEVQASMESVDEAANTLKRSGSADDRARAIRSLAAAARAGVEGSRVRAMLQFAAADENPDVATRAQEELEAIIEREDRPIPAQ